MEKDRSQPVADIVQCGLSGPLPRSRRVPATVEAVDQLFRGPPQTRRLPNRQEGARWDRVDYRVATAAFAAFAMLASKQRKDAATARSAGRRFGRPFSRPIEDQQLAFDDRGFG
jgi:hypothetical protein